MTDVPALVSPLQPHIETLKDEHLEGRLLRRTEEKILCARSKEIAVNGGNRNSSILQLA